MKDRFTFKLDSGWPGPRWSNSIDNPTKNLNFLKLKIACYSLSKLGLINYALKVIKLTQKYVGKVYKCEDDKCLISYVRRSW